MKKGLRPGLAAGERGARVSDHRPDEEGIKTRARCATFTARIFQTTDLMKKGLRPQRTSAWSCAAVSDHRPDEEGIKTGLVRRVAFPRDFRPQT